MAYIGRGTDSISNVEVLDNLTFDGSASYTLQKSSVNFVPSSANNLLISISGVVQQGNFSVSGSTITFDTTVSASDTCDWILHYGTGLITTVADGAITEAKLGSNAVTTAKINDSAVTTAKINNGAITSAKLDSGLALGKIGQVLSTTKSDTFTASVSSLTDITGLSVSITPSSTSSKILVLASVPASTATGQRFFVGLKRDSTQISQGDSASSRARVTSGARLETNEGFMDFSINFLDSPSTTSSVTYQVTGFAQNNQAFYVNRTFTDSNQSNHGRGASTITVMEVLA